MTDGELIKAKRDLMKTSQNIIPHLNEKQIIILASAWGMILEEMYSDASKSVNE